jgi:hypothetical protein
MRPPPVFVKEGYMARAHWRLRARLPMWVVYRPGSMPEYPSQWIARLWVTLPEVKPSRFVITHGTLEELRTLIPADVMLRRDPNDVPEIEESWL